MEAERAYNISDLYILKMDQLDRAEEIRALHREMFAFYTAIVNKEASNLEHSRKARHAGSGYDRGGCSQAPGEWQKTYCSRPWTAFRRTEWRCR